MQRGYASSSFAFRLQDMPLLSSLQGLRSLRTTGGAASICTDFNFDNLPALPNLQGLNQLRTVGTNLELVNLPGLTSFDGLDLLDTIQSKLFIDVRPFALLSTSNADFDISGRS
jgi:hypothetical protein